MPDGDSRIQVDAAALNKVLDHFVNSTGQAQARFEAGHIIVQVQGLTVRVEAVEIREDGLEVRLRLD